MLHHLCVGFGRDMIGHSVIDNHVALWDFGAASQGSGNSSQPARVTLLGCQNYTMSVGPEVDAAITAFDVVTPAGERYHVVVGNMHIVTGIKPFKHPSASTGCEASGGALAHARLRARDPCGARHHREQQSHFSPGHEGSSERH